MSGNADGGIGGTGAAEDEGRPEADGEEEDFGICGSGNDPGLLERSRPF